MCSSITRLSKFLITQIMHTLSNDKILCKENLTEGLLELPSLSESVSQYRNVLCMDESNRIALDNYIEDVIGVR